MDNLQIPFRLQNPEHEALRQELVRRHGSSSYMCGIFTRAFAEEFPDLHRVPGYYLASPQGPGRGEHWWLVDAAGTIVDPTADQFPEREFGHYVPYDPSLHLLPKGKCPNCGETLYASEGHHPCCAECDEALAQEFECQPQGGPYECEMDFETDLDLVVKYGRQFKGVAAAANAAAVALRQQPASEAQPG